MTALWSGRRAVFVDSSAFYAGIDHSDARHAPAIQFFHRLARDRFVPYTTNFILAECHALIMSRLGTQAGIEFVDLIEGGAAEMVRVGVEHEERARAIIRQYRDKTFSYTDATSFAVMETLGLRDAFSFDADFSQYGLRTLPGT
jgi:predicted nucleic acid-binding protein